MGALHGLPISLKDQIRLKGLETTMGTLPTLYKGYHLLILNEGYVSWIGDYSDRDATLVTILYEAGAVPFVRTNIPQTLMVCWLHLFLVFFSVTQRTSSVGGRHSTMSLAVP